MHLIVAIPPSRSIADVVKRLKGASSHHLNQMIYKGSFAWQRGHGVLSLGQRQLDVAQQYVQNQKQHHTHDTANPWLERCDDEEIEQNP
jgi:putative transposase